jgi:hypothetical protein
VIELNGDKNWRWKEESFELEKIDWEYENSCGI